MINTFRAAFFRQTPRFFTFKIPQKTLSFALFLAIYPHFKIIFSASATNDNKNEQKPSETSKLRNLMKKEDDKIRSTLQKGIDLFDSGNIDDCSEQFLRAIVLSNMMDGPINHCTGLASYYLGEIHKAKGELDNALRYYERTVECLLFSKGKNNNNGSVNFTKEEVNNLYKNTVDSVIELEKFNVVGPLSSFIRKVSIFEEFKKIQKDPQKYQDQMGKLGVIYFQMADILLVQKLKNAEEFKLKGLEYFEKNTKTTEREKMVPVYIEMGQFFRRLDSLKMAEEYYLKALPLAEKMEKNLKAAVEFEVFYKGLAKVYAETDEYEKGVNCMKKAVDLIENSMKEKTSPSEKVVIYYETGRFLKNMKKDQETLEFWEKAGKITEEQGDSQSANRRAWAIYKEIGELYENRKDLEAAKKAYEKSLGYLCKIYGKDSLEVKEAREQLEKVRKNTKKGWF